MCCLICLLRCLAKAHDNGEAAVAKGPGAQVLLHTVILHKVGFPQSRMLTAIPSDWAGGTRWGRREGPYGQGTPLCLVPAGIFQQEGKQSLLPLACQFPTRPTLASSLRSSWAISGFLFFQGWLRGSLDLLVETFLVGSLSKNPCTECLGSAHTRACCALA